MRGHLRMRTCLRLRVRQLQLLHRVLQPLQVVLTNWRLRGLQFHALRRPLHVLHVGHQLLKLLHRTSPYGAPEALRGQTPTWGHTPRHMVVRGGRAPEYLGGLKRRGGIASGGGRPQQRVLGQIGERETSQVATKDVVERCGVVQGSESRVVGCAGNGGCATCVGGRWGGGGKRGSAPAAVVGGGQRLRVHYL